MDSDILLSLDDNNRPLIHLTRPEWPEISDRPTTAHNKRSWECCATPSASIRAFPNSASYTACATTTRDHLSLFRPRRVPPLGRPVAASHDMEDASDILGGQLHVAQHGAHQPLAGLAFSDLLYYFLITISLGLAAYFLHPFYRRVSRYMVVVCKHARQGFRVCLLSKRP